jgi:hypothetical protein
MNHTNDNWIIVNSRFIKKYLSIYRPEFVLLEKVRYKPKQIIGQFNKFIYPFTYNQVFKYVTATMAVFMLGQLLYVFVALVIKYKSESAVMDISLSEYLSIIKNTRAYITKIDMKFSGIIENNNNIEIDMKLLSVKRIKNLIYAKFRYEIVGGISGTLDTVILK